MISNKKAVVIFVLGFIVGMIVWSEYRDKKPTIYDCLQLGSDDARAVCLKMYYPPNQ